ncbi:hypothetical protein HDF08_001550 [Edaphobacter lichenicola]|uniref:Uncharacterized protein n=1 Tax=Tunturiibacter lichenicola TaxID=2051959 RepID=A0A852V9A9_9BACT|nr:hypothetical protein [Edaphobacter lichenicola]
MILKPICTLGHREPVTVPAPIPESIQCLICLQMVPSRNCTPSSGMAFLMFEFEKTNAGVFPLRWSR